MPILLDKNKLELIYKILSTKIIILPLFFDSVIEFPNWRYIQGLH